jgi:hypothetical protein
MIIDTNPEFGYELACVIPYANWLQQRGELEKVITCVGMKPFYFFCDNVEEKYTERNIDNSRNGMNTIPNNWIHHNAKAVFGIEYNDLADKTIANGILDYSKWSPPSYKQYYKNKINLDKPFIVVSNRYNIEHGLSPRGYFDIECLYNIFNYLTEKGYNVIYKRPKNNEFTLDQNEVQTKLLNLNIIANVEGIGNISDYDLTKYYDNVYLLDDIVAQYNFTYNETQLYLFSSASGFISMAGGTGILCSCFEVPNITYVTTSGELRPNYFQKDSYYRKLSNASIYPIVDHEDDISKRGYRDYSELFKTIQNVF